MPLTISCRRRISNRSPHPFISLDRDGSRVLRLCPASDSVCWRGIQTSKTDEFSTDGVGIGFERGGSAWLTFPNAADAVPTMNFGARAEPMNARGRNTCAEPPTLNSTSNAPRTMPPR